MGADVVGRNRRPSGGTGPIALPVAHEGQVDTAVGAPETAQWIRRISGTPPFDSVEEAPGDRRHVDLGRDLESALTSPCRELVVRLLVLPELGEGAGSRLGVGASAPRYTAASPAAGRKPGRSLASRRDTASERLENRSGPVVRRALHRSR